jgi:hypothetical protein
MNFSKFIEFRDGSVGAQSTKSAKSQMEIETPDGEIDIELYCSENDGAGADRNRQAGLCFADQVAIAFGTQSAPFRWRDASAGSTYGTEGDSPHGTRMDLQPIRRKMGHPQDL